MPVQFWVNVLRRNLCKYMNRIGKKNRRPVARPSVTMLLPEAAYVALFDAPNVIFSTREELDAILGCGWDSVSVTTDDEPDGEIKVVFSVKIFGVNEHSSTPVLISCSKVEHTMTMKFRLGRFNDRGTPQWS